MISGIRDRVIGKAGKLRHKLILEDAVHQVTGFAQSLIEVSGLFLRHVLIGVASIEPLLRGTGGTLRFRRLLGRLRLLSIPELLDLIEDESAKPEEEAADGAKGCLDGTNDHTANHSSAHLDVLFERGCLHGMVNVAPLMNHGTLQSDCKDRIRHHRFIQPFLY